VSGANVFILFRYQQLHVPRFRFRGKMLSRILVRSLESADKVAFYSYSRDLLPGCALTGDRSEVVRGVRTSVAGDDAALYNSLLLTVQTPASTQEEKSSWCSRMARTTPAWCLLRMSPNWRQSTGIPIYMISTQDAQLEPVFYAVFERMSAPTGGKAYFAKSWRDEKKAFASIRDDLAHLYSFQLLPETKSQSRMARYQSTVGGRTLEEISHSDRGTIRPKPNRFSVGNGGALCCPRGYSESMKRKATRQPIACQSSQ